MQNSSFSFITSTIYRYLDNQTIRGDSNQRKASIRLKESVRVALFGMGRAGSIHLANIIANPRVELAYIVESDSSIWKGARTKWNLTDTTFVHPDDVSEVYKDSEVDATIICTPTFSHEEYIMGSLK